MSSQIPPNEPIFNGEAYNPSFFTASTDALTLQEASKYFLQYPYSQNSTETFTSGVIIDGNLTVDGTATFNKQIIQNINSDNIIAIGDSTTLASSTGIDNVGIGSGNMNALTTGIENTAVGVYALQNITTATTNTAIGYTSMNHAVSGNANTAVGAYSMSTGKLSGSYNCAIGENTLYDLSGNSQYNSALGYNSLHTLSYGSNNTGIGSQSLNNGYAINNCTGIGIASGYFDASGSYNTYVGATTGQISGNTNTYTNSTALGYGAITNASHQITLGTTSEYVNIPSTQSSNSTTTGAIICGGGVGIAGNINVGGTATVTGSILQSVGGNSNVALGGSGMYSSNTSGADNIGIGVFALHANTTGSNNIGIGYGPLDANTSGSYNVACGYLCLNSNTTGSNNIGIGEDALEKNTTGTGNVAIGTSVLQNNTTGINNIAIGTDTFYNGNLNNCIGIGYHSGYYDMSGSYNTYLGYVTGQFSTDSNAYSYSTCIGANASVSASHQITIGTASEYVRIPSTTTSGSYGSGALVVSGGLGIAGATNLGSTTTITGLLTANGGLSVPTGQSALFSGITEIQNAITTGTNAFTINYTTGDTWYLGTGTTLSSNFSVQMNNLGITTSNTRNMLLIYATTGHYYPTSVSAYSDNGVTQITLSSSTPLYNYGASNASGITTSVLMYCRLTIVRTFSSNYCMCEVIPYY